MKPKYAITLATLSGIALGAIAVQALHAQTKPPVYLVTEITVTNPEGYGKEYSPKAQASIKAAGGHLVALGGSGGGGANKVTAVEGEPPKRVAIQMWDSLEKMQAWRNGADYKAARQIGDKYAKFHSYAVDGIAQ
jgi:uncharacterized protein (DUF1330 family)